MKLEVGKMYRRADGSTDKIVREIRRKRYQFVGDSGHTYMDDGHYWAIGRDCLDLIEEVPADQEKG